MPDPPLDTGTKDDTGGDTRTPLWVKVFGIIALIVVLAVAFILVTRGPHRPGMHMQGGGGGDTPSSRVTALGTAGGQTPSDRSH